MTPIRAEWVVNSQGPRWVKLHQTLRYLYLDQGVTIDKSIH